MRREPVLIITAIVAVIAAIVPEFTETDAEASTQALLALVAVVGGVIARSRVTPVP